MRRQWVRLAKVLPMTGMLLIGGCGITTLQYQDFVASTAVRVFSQFVVSIMEAFVLDRFGTV